ncbi:MAG: shikimate dehydrogenase [Leptospirales bacterium]
MKRLYGIIGYPVAHSLSPVFQQAAFNATGLDAAYVPFEIPPESLSKALEGLDLLGVSGFNVTLPHKEALYDWVTKRDPAAQRVGAVNTVIRTESGWLGANTDVPGFRGALRGFLDRSVGGGVKHPLVLGAGGSARSVVAALCEMGFPALTIANRNRSRAEALISFFRNAGMNQEVNVLELGDWSRLAGNGPDLLINTLSRDAYGDEFPLLDQFLLKDVRGFYDLSYRKDGTPTPFLKIGIRNGIPVEDGIGMLLEQGALSFECWTGLAAPKKMMEETLSSYLGRPVGLTGSWR